MPNYYHDNQDILYYAQHGIDWKSLSDIIEGDYSDPEGPCSWEEALQGYQDILELVGQFSAEEIEPRAPIMDEKSTHFENGQVKVSKEHDEIFAMLKEMDFFGICLPRELDGMNIPGIVYLFICEMFARADVSTMTHFSFHVATSLTLLNYSILEGSTSFDAKHKITKTRFGKAIREIASGKTWGSMDLTEADAGSDLARLRTYAKQDTDGTWRITGTKIFITSGHGNYHLVLAKTSPEESLKSLSLFLVPLQREEDGQAPNAWVEGVEEKIGHHGSPTCSVHFDGSIGELIGKKGEGFRLMLKLMNHARLGVGFESVGLCEAAYRAAKDYAAQRITMGTTIDKHPLIDKMLDEMDITTKGIRAMAVVAATAEEHHMRTEMREHAQRTQPTPIHLDTKKDLNEAKQRVRFLTPLLKYLGAEEAVRFARMSMQIHGGNGYTKDYAPQRYLRDALVLPVYEGTSQIQALMALKDNLSDITQNPHSFLKKVAKAKFNALKASDPLERSFYKVQSMAYTAEKHIMWRVAKDKWSEAFAGPWEETLSRFTQQWDIKKDFAYGLLHAENLIRILADVAIFEILLKQAQKHPERRSLAERWNDLVEARVRYRLDLIQSQGDHLLQRLESTQTQEASA
jgi:3-(methylthio)propanoyl-CoA dehydrogenase